MFCEHRDCGNGFFSFLVFFSLNIIEVDLDIEGQ
jgi:hypothetical protein